MRSRLFRTLLELLLLLRFRNSTGSATFPKPPARANRMRMSVRLTTPTSRPEIRAPGRDDAEIDGPEGVMTGVLGEESAIL